MCTSVDGEEEALRRPCGASQLHGAPARGSQLAGVGRAQWLRPLSHVDMINSQPNRESHQAEGAGKLTRSAVARGLAVRLWCESQQPSCSLLALPARRRRFTDAPFLCRQDDGGISQRPMAVPI